MFSIHKKVLKVTFIRGFLIKTLFLPSFELIYVHSLQIYTGLHVNRL